MRRFPYALILGAGLALCLASCKTSESAYKKAYEKAKQQEVAQTATSTPTQQAATPVATTTPVSKPAASTAVPSGVRQEKVTVVAGNAISDYSVVCGSFGVKTNAENLKSYLDGQGYSSSIVFNADNNMYRVVMGTFSTHEAATQARDAFKAKYPDRNDFQGAWLLYKLN